MFVLFRLFVIALNVLFIHVWVDTVIPSNGMNRAFCMFDWTEHSVFCMFDWTEHSVFCMFDWTEHSVFSMFDWTASANVKFWWVIFGLCEKDVSLCNRQIGQLADRVCVCVCVCAYMHVCVHACMCVCVCVCVWLRTCYAYYTHYCIYVWVVFACICMW